ncbi:MAG: acyl-CoA dehydrogenase [Chloroflexi bacterium]|nr:acyl-CoA dehydrogenase [Chloroflexota bacterium]
MRLEWNETQELLRKTARDFFARECPPSRVKEIEQTEAGYAPDLWRKMASLGWLGLPFAEKDGGSDGVIMDVMALMEEIGRAALPSPYLSTVVLCGYLLSAAGTPAQRKLLALIAKGERIAALAIVESDGSYAAEDVYASAKASGDGYVLNGTKLFVMDGHIADTLIVVARTQFGGSPDSGLSLFLADATAPGISRTRLNSMGGEGEAEVVFDDVRVGRDALLGELHGGWTLVKEALRRGELALCAYAAGGAQRSLEMAVEYAKQRVQFGRPIGSFQAIQHKVADMVTDVDNSRFLAYYATWKLDSGQPCALEIAQAKAYMSDAYRRVTREAAQIFAGIGFVDNHDIQLYWRRAKACEVLFGDTDYHLERVAEQLEL